MKKTFKSVLVSSLVCALTSLMSCNGGASGELQSQVDSLSTQVQSQGEMLAYYEQCLDLIACSLDSIAYEEGMLVQATNVPEKSFSKTAFKETLDTYASMLKRQKEDIAKLKEDMASSKANVSKLQRMVEYLTKQVEEKDAKIANLMEVIESNNFTISMLKSQIDQLSLDNASLKSTVSTQNEMIEMANDMLNEAYYVVGSSSELKEAGLLSQKFLGKKKVDVNSVQADKFTKVDIRSFKSLNLNSKSPKVMSQHPENSYRIEQDKKSKTSVLHIVDEVEFWSISKFLIVQL